MSSASKKEKHRLKRQKKQTELRKQKNQSPLLGLRPGEGTLQVFVSKDWKRFGQASLFAMREARGRRILAAFLIDEGVIGLKDAWVRFDITPTEFDDVLSHASRVSPMVSCEPEAARQLIAAAIRHAHDYGFRLPDGMDKAIKVIDGVGNWQEADTSLFVPQFAGSHRDLQRCIGQPIEEFCKRTDVSFVFNDNVPSSLLDESEPDEDELMHVTDVGERTARLAQSVLEKMEDWCTRRGLTPHPALKTTIFFHFFEPFLAASYSDEETDRVMAQMLTRSGFTIVEIEAAAQQFDVFRHGNSMLLLNVVEQNLKDLPSTKQVAKEFRENHPSALPDTFIR